MPLSSDLNINPTIFVPSAVTEVQQKFNDGMKKILLKGPQWYEVLSYRKCNLPR